jgi:hypothetical protein
LNGDGRIAADLDFAELNLSGFAAFNHRLTIENGSERVNKASSGREAALTTAARLTFIVGCRGR